MCYNIVISNTIPSNTVVTTFSHCRSPFHRSAQADLVPFEGTVLTARSVVFFFLLPPSFPGSPQTDPVFFADTDFPAHRVGAGRPCALRRSGFNRQIILSAVVVLAAAHLTESMNRFDSFF
jgi:hypothetical protein